MTRLTDALQAEVDALKRLQAETAVNHVKEFRSHVATGQAAEGQKRKSEDRGQWSAVSSQRTEPGGRSTRQFVFVSLRRDKGGEL